MGDWFGGLLVAPLLLSWNAPDEPDRPPGRPLEAVGLAILLGGAAAFAFTRAYGVSAIYPLVVWAALGVIALTLALGSILTFAAIVAGSAATMKVQYYRMMRAEG